MHCVGTSRRGGVNRDQLCQFGGRHRPTRRCRRAGARVVVQGEVYLCPLPPISRAVTLTPDLIWQLGPRRSRQGAMSASSRLPRNSQANGGAFEPSECLDEVLVGRGRRVVA